MLSTGGLQGEAPAELWLRLNSDVLGDILSVGWTLLPSGLHVLDIVKVGITGLGSRSRLVEISWFGIIPN